MVQRPGGANVAGRAPLGRSWSPRSPGRVSTATPCWAFAAFTACSSIAGIWDGEVTVFAYTATSANSRSLSTSWKKSLPISSLGTCPQIASTGACDFFASYRPLSRWIAPGPTVPMQTPRRAGELGLRAHREGGGLLVAYADPLDALLRADRVGDGVERVADDAPDLGDAVVGERGRRWTRRRWASLQPRHEHRPDPATRGVGPRLCGCSEPAEPAPRLAVMASPTTTTNRRDASGSGAEGSGWKQVAVVSVVTWLVICALVVGWGWLLTHPLESAIDPTDDDVARWFADQRDPDAHRRRERRHLPRRDDRRRRRLHGDRRCSSACSSGPGDRSSWWRSSRPASAGSTSSAPS